MRELRRPERNIATPPRRGLRALRPLLVALPVAWLWRRLDAHALAAHLGAIPLRTLLAAAACSALSIAAFGERWRSLLRAWGAAAPTFRATVALILEGFFWNLLPGGVAGDLTRSHAVHRSVGGLGNALAVVWFERLCGLAGLFVVALAAMPFAPSYPRWAPLVAAVGLVGALAAFPLSAAATGSGTIARFVAAIPVLGPRLGALARPSRPAWLGPALALSVATQAFAIASMSIVVHATAPEARVASVLALSPLVVLFTFVPLTPAGVGQREAVFTAVYAAAGVGAAAAVAASVASFGVGLVVPMLGGLAVVLRASRRQAPSHDDS